MGNPCIKNLALDYIINFGLMLTSWVAMLGLQFNITLKELLPRKESWRTNAANFNVTIRQTTILNTITIKLLENARLLSYR
jgi:hypothetical protein